MVRKTQSIEIVGVGNFNIYPIKVKEVDYNKVNSEGKILNKKILEPSIPAKFIYVDKENNEVQKDKVFIDFNGLKIQQIKRTDKIKNFEIVDKTEIYNLTESGLSFLDTDETTLNIFNEKIQDKAITFKLKKSTIGFNFYRAYILKLNGILVMISGKGNLSKAIEEFKQMNINKQEKTEIIIQKVEVKADEIEDLIQI